METTKTKAIVEEYFVWLSKYKGRSDRTIEEYMRNLQRLSDYLKDKDLLQATSKDLEYFVGAHMSDLGITMRSRRPTIAAIKGFYRWAAHDGYIQSNIAEDITYPRIARKLAPVITIKAVEDMLVCCDMRTFLGARDASIIGVLAGCGLRVSGLVNLNQEDIVIDEAEDGSKGGYVRVSEKGGNERFVPLPKEALLLVQVYLGYLSLEDIDTRLPDGDNVLFVNTRHKNLTNKDNYGETRRLSTWGIRQVLQKYGRLAGVHEKYCHPHALRHLYGTELVESDVDLLSIRQLMGHKDLESSKFYVHLAKRKLRSAVTKGNPLGKMRTPVTELLNKL